MKQLRPVLPLVLGPLILAALLPAALAATLPSFAFSTKPGSNMMMGHIIELSAAPKLKLVSHRASGQSAALVYSGSDAKGAFGFYDQALKAEGWQEDMAMGMMKGGGYEEHYKQGALRLDLTATPKNGRVTVAMKVR